MERLAKECKMRLYRTSVKEDLNVSGVFQHLGENYVNKVKSFSNFNGSLNGGPRNGGGGGLTGIGMETAVDTFQIGASSMHRNHPPHGNIGVRPNFATNSYVTTGRLANNGPLYITKPVSNSGPPPRNNNFFSNKNSNGYVPSMYSHNPTRNHRSVISTPGSNSHGRYSNVSSFSPQDYLNSPLFDSLNHRRYWPHSSSTDRTITLRPLSSKKLNGGTLHRKMMAPRSACKVLS